MSGVRTGEIDLASEAIREWEPQPLSHLALPEEAHTEELRSFRWQVALLGVFLHEIHHLVQPKESEIAVRERSQRFYTDSLTYFVAERFGVQYGLRQGASGRAVFP
jgi:hypothetical protein